jgi:Putative restriction endonuclease
VDDSFIEEGARVEAIGGRIVVSPPAKEPHARRHAGLGYVLSAHVAPGYTAALDMLTRTSETSNFAPDASVYPEARDPETGGRRLEELAFEIADTQPLGDAAEKARELVKRGVRRVFCLVVKQSRLLEWSRATDGWGPLRGDDAIVDACFVRPLPIVSLLDAARADEAVVAALDARRHPAIVAIEMRGREEGREEGRDEGRREALLVLLRARGLSPTATQAARIAAERDRETIDRWIGRAASASSVGEVLAKRG